MRSIKTKKAMSLFEVMITLCISSLLFISIASTFYMFRIVNSSAVNNSQKSLNMMSIKDYVENNIDNILLKKIKGICMYVDVDELGNDYNLYIGNRNYYLVETKDDSRFVSEHPSSRFVTHLGDIKLYKDSELQTGENETVLREPITNINGDYIIRVGITELSDDMHFFLTQIDSEYNELMEYSAHMFNEVGSEYCDAVGESIYYSKIDNPDILNGMFSDMFTYRKGDTNVLYMKIGDEEPKAIFDNLKYENLEVGLNIKSYTYAFPDLSTVESIDNATPIPTYGVSIKTAIVEDDESYDKLKAGDTSDVNLRFVDNGDNGVAYLDRSEYINDLVIISSKEVSLLGSEVKQMMSNDIEVALDPLIEEREIGDGTNYSYEFIGWLVDGEYYPDYTIAVNKPESEEVAEGSYSTYDDTPERECIAVFNRYMTDSVHRYQNIISADYRYQYCQKEIYVIVCNIKYTELNEDNATEDKEISFATRVFYKYTPEVYTGE